MRTGLAVALAVMPLAAHSQTGAVKGTVVDSDGAAVDGAGIWVDNPGSAPGTDSSGRFLILGLTPGNHTLRVTSFVTDRFDTTFRVVSGETTTVALVVQRTTPREVWLGCKAATNAACETGRMLWVPLGFAPMGRGVVRDKATWIALWEMATRGDDTPTPLVHPPVVDWSREMVIISSFGSNMYDANGGNPVGVNRVTYDSDRVVVVIGADTIVRRGKCCLDAIISPAVIAIPRSDLPVVFQSVALTVRVPVIDWRDSVNAWRRSGHRP